MKNKLIKDIDEEIRRKIRQMKYIPFFLFFLILLLFSTTVGANTYLIENFTWQENLVAVNRATLTLGDIDSDGDLDLALTGFLGGYHNKIYTNNGTSLVENATWEQNLTGVRYGSSAFGDIDNDGDLDLALMGCSSGGDILSVCDSGAYESFIYINNGTSLMESSTWKGNIVNVWKGTLAFGDVDNDGKLDLTMNGQSETEGKVSKIYINNGTGFEENSTWEQDLTDLFESSLAWGDIDNDHDLDLIMVGDVGVSDERAKVYINNGTSLAENSTWQTNLLGTEHSSIALGDMDSDGDLDLTLIGHTTVDNHRVYENTGITFIQNQTDRSADFNSGTFSGIYEGSQSLGDYDNDGDLDLITNGKEGHTTLYLYDGSFFTDNTKDPESDILNLQSASYIVWGDLDNDSDLDLIETGYIEEGINANRIKIYLNNITTPNIPPHPPNSLNASYQNGLFTLSWGNASDNETTALGLYYNLKVGNSSNKHSIVSGVYGGGDDNGYFGNMMQRKSITLKNLNLQPNQTIYWSVQTIDTTLKAGNWSVEQNYTLPTDITQPSITLNAPIDQFNTTNFNITFNATVSDNANLTNVSLYGNWSGWHLNETNSSGINNTYYIFTQNLTAYGDGTYQWLIEAKDASNNSINSSTRTFRIDTTYPTISLTTPANASSWTSSSTVTFTYNVTDLAILNCSLIIDRVFDQPDDTIATDTAQTFSKSLSNGNYNWSINCTDTVDYENASETRTLTVSYTAPSSSSSSGGGGGGGGGSGGTTTTSETKSTGTIPAGETKTISFTKDLGITDIEITAKSSVSDTVKVEDITSSPSVPSSPISSEEGAVYKYLSLTASKVSAALEKAIINFKVTKSWLNRNNLDENTVELKRLNNNLWGSLPTEKTGADSNYVYYSAETSGFSKFAIIGKKKVTLAEVEVPQEEVKENITGNITEKIAEEITPQEPEEEKPMLPERKYKWYFLIALVFFLGFGYLIIYEMYLKKKRK